jgi:hypothetical protein
VVVRITEVPSLCVTVAVLPAVVETVRLMARYKDLDTSGLTVKLPLSIVVWVSAVVEDGRTDIRSYINT